MHLSKTRADKVFSHHTAVGLKKPWKSEGEKPTPCGYPPPGASHRRCGSCMSVCREHRAQRQPRGEIMRPHHPRSGGGRGGMVFLRTLYLLWFTIRRYFSVGANAFTVVSFFWTATEDVLLQISIYFEQNLKKQYDAEV